jgi:aminoglycoside/choline kinase family phosphotransferase
VDLAGVAEELESYKDFKRLFYLQTVQRLLKVMGSFLFLTFEKKIPKYAESISRAADMISLVSMEMSKTIDKDIAESLNNFNESLVNALIQKSKEVS